MFCNCCEYGEPPPNKWLPGQDSPVLWLRPSFPSTENRRCWEWMACWVCSFVRVAHRGRPCWCINLLYEYNMLCTICCIQYATICCSMNTIAAQKCLSSKRENTIPLHLSTPGSKARQKTKKQAHTHTKTNKQKNNNNKLLFLPLCSNTLLTNSSSQVNSQSFKCGCLLIFTQALWYTSVLWMHRLGDTYCLCYSNTSI